MSSRRSYSRESRSHYSRSSSYENRKSNSLSSSYHRRPLSSLLIERDYSSPSLALDRFDDPFFFERRSRFFDDFDRRLRWRFDDDLFDDEFFRKDSLAFGRNIPINHQNSNLNSNYYSSSIQRNIPVQYSTASTNKRENISNNKWATSSFNNNNNYQKRENRLSTNEWTPKQESPTRKRTSMTIFVRQPHVQYSEVPFHERTMSTPTYSSTLRTNYY